MLHRLFVENVTSPSVEGSHRISAVLPLTQTTVHAYSAR
jgi:hypothetical protein